MTEQEAKLRWCPFVRLVAGSARPDGSTDVFHPQSSFNRIQRENLEVVISPTTHCIGSACMAWHTIPRMKWLVSYDDKPEELWDWDPSEHVLHKHHVKVRPAEPLGYCGLAGKP